MSTQVSPDAFTSFISSHGLSHASPRDNTPTTTPEVRPTSFSIFTTSVFPSVTPLADVVDKRSWPTSAMDPINNGSSLPVQPVSGGSIYEAVGALIVVFVFLSLAVVVFVWREKQWPSPLILLARQRKWRPKKPRFMRRNSSEYSEIVDVEANAVISPFVSESAIERLENKGAIRQETPSNNEGRSDSSITVRSIDTEIESVHAAAGEQDTLATTTVAHSLPSDLPKASSSPPIVSSSLPMASSPLSMASFPPSILSRPPPTSPIAPVRSPPPTYRAAVRKAAVDGGVSLASLIDSKSHRRDGTSSSEGTQSTLPPPYQTRY